jgi:hypothetical protein
VIQVLMGKEYQFFEVVLDEKDANDIGAFLIS